MGALLLMPKRIEMEDLSLLYQWYITGALQYSHPDLKDYVGHQRITSQFLHRYRYAILDFLLLYEEKAVGLVIFRERNLKDRHTQLVVDLVGRHPSLWQAFQTTLLFFLGQLFQELNFHKVYIPVAQEDVELLERLKQIGFIQEGQLQNHIRYQEKITSVYIMSLFKSTLKI